MADERLVIDYANRFEAIAAAGFEGEPWRERLVVLVAEVRGRGMLAPRVAAALDIMIDAIRRSDPAGRFERKIAMLREATVALGHTRSGQS